MTFRENGIVDVGDENDTGFRDELDEFFTEIGMESPVPLHGTGEEVSMHTGIMHTMENPPPCDGCTPLTALIKGDPLHT